MADASKIMMVEGDAPATPSAGQVALYPKTDHLYYTKGSDGVEHSLVGVDGDDAYVYVAYASADDGTDFTMTFNAALEYIAILSTATAIASPAVGDFAGLWAKYVGTDGAGVTSETVGFTITSGATPKTLTVALDANVAGTNTGDQTISDATITTSDVTTNDASTTKHGFLLKATAPAAGLLNVVGIANGETVYANKALFDATDPSTQAYGDSAAVGTAMAAARRDHKHAMPAAGLANVVEDTTPQLGGNLDINEKSIEREFGTLTSDHTASGDIITATAGENVAFGEVCYFKSDGKFWKTDADAEATSKGLLVMAIATIAGDASGLFLKTGLARDDAWNWTVGAELFLDTATAGGMTATAPSGSTDIVRLVGYGKGADYVEFKPSTMYLEIA